jgi:hypothetical protein
LNADNHRFGDFDETDLDVTQVWRKAHCPKSALLLQGAELVQQRHRRSRDIGEVWIL